MAMSSGWGWSCRAPLAETGKVHRMGWIRALLTYRRRRLPPYSRVHASVRTRVDEFQAYGSPVSKTVTWADEDWPTTRG